jgi:hypothetical protein
MKEKQIKRLLYEFKILNMRIEVEREKKKKIINVKRELYSQHAPPKNEGAANTIQASTLRLLFGHQATLYVHYEDCHPYSYADTCNTRVNYFF